MIICIYLGCGPLTVTVTTRIITFLVGTPYKPSFTSVTVRGPYPTYTIFRRVLVVEPKERHKQNCSDPLCHPFSTLGQSNEIFRNTEKWHSPTPRKIQKLEPKRSPQNEKEHHLNHPPPFLGLQHVNFPGSKFSCGHQDGFIDAKNSNIGLLFKAANQNTRICKNHAHRHKNAEDSEDIPKLLFGEF